MIRIIDTNHIQRVAVVDADGRLLGMISRDSLLRTGFGASAHEETTMLKSKKKS